MLLPQAERRDELHFYVAKSLSYGTRLKIAFNLVFAGLVIQILTPTYFYAGLPLMLAGVLLVLTKGYDNKPQGRRQGSAWRPATVDEATRIVDIDRRSANWDQDSYDITNIQGLVVFALIAVPVAGATLYLHTAGHEQLKFILPSNAAVLLLPFWFTGTRSILKKDGLLVRTNFILAMHRGIKDRLDESERFEYQIRSLTMKDGATMGQEPRDIKGGIRWSNAADDFLGMQMQVSLNHVQGTKYPYFYCVLVAKKGRELLKVVDRVDRPPNIVAEYDSQEDVDVLVIRQKTTKESGYHTGHGVARRILNLALMWGRQVAEASAKP